ncbi:MAG: N-acetylmuramoyl-L-alanine amidase [Clostridia bacterium]|nr:N-acetylmuramoyl-L-alanine amidase [Clostridia bacterium]
MRFYTISVKRLYTVVIALSLAIVLLLFGVVLLPQASVALEDALAASGEAALPSKLIILDAGHGGEDCGAIGANGVYEKDLNLAMTMTLGEELRALGYTVIYTRTEDRLLYNEEENIKGFRKIYDLRNRCALAEEYPDALFVSVHMNSFGDARYSGLQVYYAPDREDSRAFAEHIQQAVVRDVQAENRRSVKSGNDLYLLEHIENPVVLVECGFISNVEECAKLDDVSYREALAKAIAQGIVAYDTAEK